MYCISNQIIRGRSHHPQSQGKVERSHQSWREREREREKKKVSDKKATRNFPSLDWTDLIPMVEMAYNGYHRSIGVSPYQCMSGSQSNTIASSAKGGLCVDFEDDDVDTGDGGNGDIVSDCNGNNNDDLQW